MTFLALGTTNVLYGDTILRTVLQIFVEFLVDAVELVAIVSSRIREIDFRGTVTVNTPAHAEGSELFYLIHLLDGAMTGLALYLAGIGMLGMAEEYMVGEAVDLNPFYGFGRSRIVTAGLGIVAGVAVQFLYLSRTIYFAAVFAV